MRRLPGPSSSRQSAVSRAGGPAWPGLAAAAPPGLDGRGSCRRGWARSAAMPSRSPGAVVRVGVEVAEDDDRAVGERRRSRPASSRNGGAGEVVRTRSDLVVVAPAFRPSGPSKSGGVGLEARRCRRRPSGRATAGPSARARRGAARAVYGSGKGAVGALGEERRGDRSRAGGGSCGRRRRRAGAARGAPCRRGRGTCPSPRRRPSRWRGRRRRGRGTEGSPALTWAWKACG